MSNAVSVPTEEPERREPPFSPALVEDDVADIAGWITPRIGGVGPMTRAMLLTNVVQAAERSAGI